MIKISNNNVLHKLIILYAIIVLLAFAGVLTLIANDRINEFHSSQKLIAKQATETVAAEIERTFSQKRILVRSFIDDNHDLFKNIIKSPKKDTLQQILNNKLSKYFFNYYSSNIATTNGDLLLDNFDGNVGEVCIQDMKEYRVTKTYKTSLHPGNVRYHYDIFTSFNAQNKHYQFLASFTFNELINILKLSNPVDHELFLTQVESNYLIEISTSGIRKNFPNRLDYRMTEQEKDRILSAIPIKGTKWHVVDLHSEKLFTEYKNDIYTRVLIIYIFCFVMAIIFTSLLTSQVKKNQVFSNSILEKNKKIEILNDKLNKMNEMLSKQNITDGLTNIYNRRYFDIQILKEWNIAARLGLTINIAIVDIDYFKQYNDTYGHQAGDDCLKDIAIILNDAYKRTNEFVARYGGEEFIIVNLGSPTEIFQSTLEDIIVTIREKEIVHKGSKIKPYLTISIGYASTIDAEKSTHTELVEHADKALYAAKGQGRDQLVIYNPT